jgi:sec-independent protein translocase protein TatA
LEGKTMGNLGFSEIMIVLLVVLVFFGAKRMPEIGASFGKGIREFKRSFSGIADEVNNMPEDRSATTPGRQLDTPVSTSSTSATSGEPKRLSQ